MVAPFSKFYGKISGGFCTLDNAFSERFHFKTNKKSIGSSKIQA